jgi:hypothetical protein
MNQSINSSIRLLLTPKLLFLLIEIADYLSMRIHQFAILYLVPATAFLSTPPTYVPPPQARSSSSSLHANRFFHDGVAKSLMGAFAGMTIASQVAFAALPQLPRDIGACSVIMQHRSVFPFHKFLKQITDSLSPIDEI